MYDEELENKTEDQEYDPWDPDTYGTYVFEAKVYSKKTDKYLYTYKLEDYAGEMYLSEAESIHSGLTEELNRKKSDYRYYVVDFYFYGI